MKPAFVRILTLVTVLEVVAIGALIHQRRADALAHRQATATCLARARDATSMARGPALERALHASAVAAASAGLARSAVAPPLDDAVLRRAFLGAVRGRDWARGERLLERWQPGPDDVEAGAAHVRLLLQRQRYEEARDLAWQWARRSEDARDSFVRLWYGSWEPILGADEVLTLHADGTFDSARSFDVASSVLIRLFRDGAPAAILKPAQTNPWSNYRGEIAAYRLCPLIHCDLTIPRNREVRIGEADLAALMGLGDGAVRRIRRNDYEPVWFVEGNGTRWLYATMKDWVPDFVHFPIEERSSWRHLVEQDTPLERLRGMSLAEGLSALRTSRPEWRVRFAARAEGVDAFTFAHQLSDMHVLDALINNWDRYSSLTPGSNCMWAAGRFLSIDNAASFHTPEEWRGEDVWVRLRRVERFSRDTVDAIRWMNTEALFRILFPPNPFIEDERERWTHFLERRQRVLDYVDELIARYGEAEVLAFP